ncbi:MAG: GDSL-type esterase/lipase family protein [Roseburia sp.]|nr:GDSL-type esterase/lipase family protein [Roseburia sp.]
MYKKDFDFCRDKAVLYDRQRGHGFVTERNRREEELLQLAELNTGFDVPYWYRDETVTEILTDEHGCYVDSQAAVRRIAADGGRLIPLCFKADVERQGNYEVRLTLYGRGEILVFAGARRLVYKGCMTEEGAVECSFLLNVCDIIPRGKTCMFEKRSIDIAVLGEAVRLSTVHIEQVNCPTLYIAGDSTVTDQSAEYPYAPGTSYSGWGQMLGWYLNKGIAVSNHAHSGLTVESFRSEGHYAIVQANFKQGDYLFMQFGHNDQKLMHLKAKGGYRDGLAAYIEETRQRGGYPVIVTPLARNTWKADDGTYNDLLAEYADVCIALGEELQVPVVDLHGRSMAFVIGKGLEAAKPFFFPKDYTHTNDYGAYKMAGFVVADYLEKTKGVRSDAYRRLAGLMRADADVWEARGAIALPEIPEQYRHVQNPEGDTALFADLERPDETLTRVEALDMVIKTARFFPTNVFNDIYEDIVGHEWYAGTVECAYQNGIIPAGMTPQGRFEPEKQVRMEEFLALVMGGYRSRRKLPEEAPCALDAACTAYCVPYVRAAYALGVVRADEDLQAALTRARAAEICRALNI